MSLINTPTNELTTHQLNLIKKTVEYERASLSPNTLRSYKSMWKKFEQWCEQNNLSSLPASSETIALYISYLGETVSFSTLDSTLAAISAVHEKGNIPISGDIQYYRRVRKGIRRLHKENQSLRQAPALTVLDLKGICCRLGDNIKDIRDKSIITMAFFGALRRSEVSSLNIENIQFSDKGITIVLLQSKTSDSAQNVYISYAKDKDICPVRALKRWLDVLKADTGPLFLFFQKGERIGQRISGHSISNIIKRHFGEKYSGHSTRRGLVTASAEKGTPLHVIKKHSRHKSADIILHYIEDSRGFEDSSVSVLGV